MITCTFFGHKDTPKEIETSLSETLIDLIKNKNVDSFYVGNQGNFDFIVRKCLKVLSHEYPHIKYAVVLAYMPSKCNRNQYEENYEDTIYPDGLEKIPKRYAISKRNNWMLDNSEYVITYVVHRVGGAGKFKELAEKKGKTVINLANQNQQ